MTGHSVLLLAYLFIAIRPLGDRASRIKKYYKQFYVRFHPQGEKWSAFGMYTQLVYKGLNLFTA